MDYKKIVSKLGKVSIELKLSEKNVENFPIGKSKFGGCPDLPDGFEWPYYEGINYEDKIENRPLAFLAQINLNEQARQILKIAEEYGVEQNFFFITTFKRYQVQIGILTDLERTINEEGTLVTKEYVKGRKNVYSHPAISDYNRTTDSANKTVKCLLGLINKDSTLDKSEDTDPLLDALAIE